MSAWENLKEDLADGLAEMVFDRVVDKFDAYQKNGFKFCYSEEETAEILGVALKTLQRERLCGAIDHSSFRGKAVYQPHHILNYLQKHEVRNGKQSVTLDDVLGRAKKVLEFPKAA